MKTYAYCGISHRTLKLEKDIPEDCHENWKLAALWDVDPKRFEEFDAWHPGHEDCPRFLGAEDYEQMLTEVRPDLVFVCTRDCYHADYMIKALEQDIDVVVEKPMTTHVEETLRVLEAEKNSKARVIVAFNYRFMNKSQKIKELVESGAVGRVTTVEANIYYGEGHGSSFFQRWNRERKNSGGLAIHKEGHYLDLISWWINDKPQDVFCFTDLKYYGPDAELNPSKKADRKCRSCDEIEHCAYRFGQKSVAAKYGRKTRKGVDDEHSADLMKNYLDKSGKKNTGANRELERYTGYSPDMCVFDPVIDIEDVFSATIRYKGGPLVTFAANFSSPFENERFVISGTRGRIECGYTFAPDSLYESRKRIIAVFPLFSGKPEYVPVEVGPGGHYGADPVMLRSIFTEAETAGMKADSRDGARAVATGEAMWRSGQTGQPISIKETLGEWW